MDDPSGKIGSLNPGDAGYIAAALGAATTQSFYGPGVAGGTQGHLDIPAGKYIAFYAITNGTTADFLANNPNNNPTGSAVALFSYPAANPDQINHFRWFNPEGSATGDSQLRLHIMEEVFGSDNNFDDLALSLG